MPTTHPTAIDLAAFAAGRANPVVSVHIERHLADRPACCQALLQWPDDDRFVARLRAFATTPRPDFGPPTADLRAHFDPAVQPTLPPSDDETLPGIDPGKFCPGDVPAALRDHPRYRIIRRLGTGGMGTVFLAEHRLMNRGVAIKVIRPELVRSQACARRFRREVQAASSLSHPNIVAAHDAEQVGDLHLLVMEFVAGIDLFQLVNRRGPLPVAQACEYASQAARGLQRAADQHMVHRDIKPQNLMLTTASALSESGQGQERWPSMFAPPTSAPPTSAPSPITLPRSPLVKILDFGLASFVGQQDEPGGLTSDGAILGTPDFIAPEQARDARRADIRADIYSLGCTLRFLLTGHVLRPEGTALEKIMAHVESEAAPLGECRDDVPPGLQRVLDRMTARNPEDRYQSPAEVATALAPFAAGVSPAVPATARPRRKSAFAIVLAIALAMLSFGAFPVLRVATNRGTLRIESSDDVQIVLKQDGREFKVIDVTSGSQVTQLPSGEYEAALRGNDIRLRLDRHGFTLSRGGEAFIKVRQQPPIAPAPPKPVEIYRLQGHKEWVMSVAFAPSGRELASASIDDTVKFWNPVGGEALLSINAHAGDLRAVVYSPDGARLATASHDHTIKLWDAATKEPRHTLSGHEGPVTSLAFNPAGTVLYSSSDDGTLRAWDVASGSAAGTPAHLPAAVSAVACSPDGSLVATGGKDNAVSLWDASLQPIATLTGHVDEVRSLAFSHRGALLASGSKDGTVRLWDVPGRSYLAMLSPYEGRVYGVAFSPDDRWLAAGGGDWGWGSVKLWDVATRKPLATLEGHAAFVHAVAFSPDGALLATGAGDWTVRIWQMGTTPVASSARPPAEADTVDVPNAE